MACQGIAPHYGLAGGDALARPLCERFFPAAIDRIRQWSGWIRMMLREAEGCQPTAEELTELLGIDTHTLARTLAKEGLSFREIAKRIRYEKACELLKDPNEPITQVAYRLGYSDSANFSRAFQAVSGVSPRTFRRSWLARRDSRERAPRGARAS